MGSLVEKRLITADEYLRMAEVGILGEDEHLELIDGEIVKMSPSGKKHAFAVARLMRMLLQQIPEDACFIWCQATAKFTPHFVPEPDILLLNPEVETEDRDPSVQDVLAVIEVSDSTLTTDRKVKMPRYAAIGIPELWIVNLRKQEIEVYRYPDLTAKTYREVRHCKAAEALSPQQFPKAVIDLSRLFA